MVKQGLRRGRIAKRHQKNSGWGWRRLKRFKMIGGKLMQLHATRGWKPA